MFRNGIQLMNTKVFLLSTPTMSHTVQEALIPVVWAYHWKQPSETEGHLCQSAGKANQTLCLAAGGLTGPFFQQHSQLVQSGQPALPSGLVLLESCEVPLLRKATVYMEKEVETWMFPRILEITLHGDKFKKRCYITVNHMGLSSLGAIKTILKYSTSWRWLCVYKGLQYHFTHLDPGKQHTAGWVESWQPVGCRKAPYSGRDYMGPGMGMWTGSSQWTTTKRKKTKTNA